MPVESKSMIVKFKHLVYLCVAFVGSIAVSFPLSTMARSITPDLEKDGWKVLGFPGKIETR